MTLWPSWPCDRHSLKRHSINTAYSSRSPNRLSPLAVNHITHFTTQCWFCEVDEGVGSVSTIPGSPTLWSCRLFKWSLECLPDFPFRLLTIPVSPIEHLRTDTYTHTRARASWNVLMMCEILPLPQTKCFSKEAFGEKQRYICCREAKFVGMGMGNGIGGLSRDRDFNLPVSSFVLRAKRLTG